jgi:hypothetical protein
VYHASQRWFASMGASGSMNEPPGTISHHVPFLSSRRPSPPVCLTWSNTKFDRWPATMQAAIVSNQLTARKAKSIGSTSTYCIFECMGRRPPLNRNLPERVAHVFAKSNVTRSRVDNLASHPQMRG